MLTQKPVMARIAAAMATASKACCGTVDNGSVSRLAATPVVLTMADPAGRTAASPAGTPPEPGADEPAPGEVASHHCETWAAASELLVSTSCRRLRSTMRAPPPADTVGKVDTAATIFTLIAAPLICVCTTEPTPALLAARKFRVAMPGSVATGGVPVRVRSPLTGLGGWPANALAASPKPGLNVTVVAPLAAALALTAGAAEAPTVPVVCLTLVSSTEEPAAGQLASMVPGWTAVPGPAEKLDRVKTASDATWCAGMV